LRQQQPNANRGEVRAPNLNPDGEHLEGRPSGLQRVLRFSFPQRFPIVQFPNAVLIVALVAGQVAGHVHGKTHPYLSSLAFLALGAWSYDELAHGVNWFRRVLGGAVGLLTLISVAHALHR
jgi:hypothetical protein